MNNEIAVIFGGPSPEHDISILTGLQSSRVLNNKYNVHNIYWSKENKWYLVDDNLESQDFINNNKIFKKELTLKLDSNPGFYLKKKKLNIDTVLNACHGGPGEDGTLQSLLTLLEINFTGPSLTTSQLCMDKYSFYTFMKANNIPVLEKHLLQNSHSPTFEGPYILKPRFGGSSIGVEVVNEYDTALKLADGSKLYQQGATVEKF
jgi:D-alanine-D-alanine ligase